MFDTIYIEKNLEKKERIDLITKQFPKADIKFIDNYEEVFGAYRKPYLQKRTRFNLFLAEKRGQLVKEAPDAYGVKGEAHYYYVHAYNCIYECEYCYLQGYFDSPDIVLFLNHEDILKEMEKIAIAAKGSRIWFHAGEFSDSLALSHITGELEAFWPFFKKYPNVQLELRTKSVNVRALEKLEPSPNIHISFSLGSPEQVSDYEHKTASLKNRLIAIEKLQNLNFSTAIHFDPIVYSENFASEYAKLVSDIKQGIDLSKIAYFSLGVVRFTKKVHQEFVKNYPDSKMLGENFINSFDNKVRYNRPMRMNILRSVERILVHNKVDPNKIYLCME